MYIQYVGFNVAARSRTYNFDVLDNKEAREFTVQVQSGAFRPAGLKLQDGPGICFARLQQELEGETPASRAEPHLGIREKDITILASPRIGGNPPPNRRVSSPLQENSDDQHSQSGNLNFLGRGLGASDWCARCETV
jgi:hypothetical protein